MHPELRALLLEVCAREDCPPELRAVAVEYLSGARKQMSGPTMQEHLHLTNYWYDLWNDLSWATWAHHTDVYVARARKNLDRTPPPPHAP